MNQIIHILSSSMKRYVVSVVLSLAPPSMDHSLSVGLEISKHREISGPGSHLNHRIIRNLQEY